MRTETLTSHDERLRRALPLLVAGLRDGRAAVRLEDLARAGNTTPDYLRHVFRDQAGEPLHRHLRRLRLLLAAYHLLHGDRAVIDIALGAGYHSHAAFTRAFTAVHGRCPSDLRTDPAGGARHGGGPDATVPRRLAVPERTVAFPDHLGPAGGTATAWERLRDWLTGAGHGAALFPCPSRTKALGVTVDDPGHFLDARTHPEAPAPGAPAPGVPAATGPAHTGSAHTGSAHAAPAADFAAATRTVPAATGLALRHTGPPELIPFTYLRLAVTAATHGLLPAGRPPLPYYLEFTPSPSPHPERQVAVDVYVLPGNPPAPA